MNKITLQVEQRNETGKGPARRLRAAGQAPAIFYGRKTEPVKLAINVHEFKKALEDHTQAIRLDPELVEAYYTRGLLYEYMKDYDSAIGDYNRVLTLKPDYAEVREQREIALRKKLGA